MWARKIQKDQKELLLTLLGSDYFETHPNERVRNSQGFIFIQAMTSECFLNEVVELKSKFENV